MTMKKAFGKIIISQQELDRKIESARIQGRREAQTALSKEKRDIMLSFGFFPVTDEFWIGIGRADFAGYGFDWAYYAPDGKRQKFMPFHGWHFNNKTGFEIQYEAHKSKTLLEGNA